MQSGVSVENHEISGTLHYVTGYTGFSGEAELQEGHYLALKIDTEDENDTITVELVGGTVGHPVELDSDRNIVLHLGDIRKQRVRVVTTHNNVSTTETFYLNQLVLEEAE